MNHLIIDTEVHLMHPEACHRSFADNVNELACDAIHKHPDFHSIKNMLNIDFLLDSMHKNEISHALLMGIGWGSPDIQRDNNDYIEEVIRQHSGIFKGLFIPSLADPVAAAEEIMQLDNKIYIGIKLIPNWQGFRVDDNRLNPIWQAALKRNLFVMVHTDHPTQSLDGDTPYRFLSFVQNNPDLKVLAPHMAGNLALYAVLPNVMKSLQNVFFITSVSSTMIFVEFAVKINPNNILFGTDFPFNHCHDQCTVLDAFMALQISEKQRENILGIKAKKLFGF